MINEQAIKEAFSKIREDIEIIKNEIQELSKKINDFDSYEDLIGVKKWNVLLVDGKRKVRWDGNGREREWEKKKERERSNLLNLFL